MSEPNQDPIKSREESGGQSSDSARSRSLSPGRSPSRREDTTADPGQAKSKWCRKSKSKAKAKLEMAASEGDSADEFVDPVSKRTRNRQRRQKKVEKAQSSPTENPFKIPKIPKKPENPAQSTSQNLTPEIFEGEPHPKGDPNPSSDDGGFDPDLDTPDFNLPEVNTECESYQRWVQLQAQSAQSQTGRGIYVPVVTVVKSPSNNPNLIPDSHVGQDQVPADSSGAGLEVGRTPIDRRAARATPYPKEPPRKQTSTPTEVGSQLSSVEKTAETISTPAKPVVDPNYVEELKQCEELLNSPKGADRGAAGIPTA